MVGQDESVITEPLSFISCMMTSVARGKYTSVKMLIG